MDIVESEMIAALNKSDSITHMDAINPQRYSEE